MRFFLALFRFTYEILETMVFAGSMFIVIFLFIAFPTSVQGSSMEPNLHNNDRIIISKISYKIEPVKRGDVIVLQSPSNSDIWFVKRVIALPGESIKIQSGSVYVNDSILNEPYISHESTNTWENGFLHDNETYLVPQDYFFVLGDNRPRSSDSRMFGPVHISSVVGKAIYRFFPPNQTGFVLQ